MRGARSHEDIVTLRVSGDEAIDAGRGTWRTYDGNGGPDAGIKSLTA